MRRRRTNRYIKKLQSLTGEAEFSRAVQQVIGRHRSVGDSLEKVARRLGVDHITEQRMSFDGGIYDTGSKVEIRLNLRSSTERQRYTLAHEIGHLLLELEVKGKRNCTDDSDLEKACDLIAAELLMPADEVFRYAPSLPGETPASLRIAASHFRVSLHAAAIRLRKDLRIWNRSIGLWEKKEKARELWFVGPRPWTSSRQDFDVFARAQQTQSTVSAREFCWKGAGVQAVSLQVLSLGNHRLLGTVSEGVISNDGMSTLREKNERRLPIDA